jgi:hypothetical protein
MILETLINTTISGGQVVGMIVCFDPPRWRLGWRLGCQGLAETRLMERQIRRDVFG